MRKAQITIFIIVGIVILFVLAFGVYSVSLMQKPAVAFTAPSENSNRVCLEQVSEQAVLDLLSFGGTPSGIGSANNEHVAIGKGDRVSAESYLEFKAEPNNLMKRIYFGTYQLEPLCLRDGPNRPNANLDNTNTCMTGTYQLFEPDDEVLQYALQRSIETGLQAANCTEQGSVSVLIGGDDITIRTENTTVRMPVRLKRLYNAAYMFVKQETTDLDFNLNSVPTLTGCVEPYMGNNCLLPGISISTDSTSNPEYIFVNITDKEQVIRGQPATLRFVIENRPPVIKETLSTDSEQKISAMYVWKEFAHPNNAPFTFTKVLQVRDPDDTSLEGRRCKLFDPLEPEKYESAPSGWIDCKLVQNNPTTEMKVDITPKCFSEEYEYLENLPGDRVPIIVEFCKGSACNNVTANLTLPINSLACDAVQACKTWRCFEPPYTCGAEPDSNADTYDTWETCDKQYEEVEYPRYEACMDGNSGVGGCINYHCQGRPDGYSC